MATSVTSPQRTAGDLLDERNRVVADWRNAQRNGPSPNDHPDAWRMPAKREELEHQILEEHPDSEVADVVRGDRGRRAEEQQNIDAARSKALQKANEIDESYGVPIALRQKMLTRQFDAAVREGFSVDQAWEVAGERIEESVKASAAERREALGSDQTLVLDRAELQHDTSAKEEVRAEPAALDPEPKQATAAELFRNFTDRAKGWWNRNVVSDAPVEESQDVQVRPRAEQPETKPAEEPKVSLIQRWRDRWNRRAVSETPDEQPANKEVRVDESTKVSAQATTAEKVTIQQPSEDEMRAAALEAKRNVNASQRTAELAEIKAMPGVETNWQARRIYYEAKVRSLIKPWGDKNEALDKAYESFSDRKANALIADYWKEQKNLSNANTDVSPLLWTAKQYRALERSEQIKAKLSELRPMASEYHTQAVRNADGSVGIKQQQAEQRQSVFAEGLKRESPAQRPVPVQSAREELVPPIDQSKRLAALEAAKELRAGVAVEGWKKPGAKEMYDSIIKQLSRDGAQKVTLTTYYGGNDPKVARDVHDVAIERNADVIEAVRSKGIPVDTGEAKLYVDLKKKTEIGEGVAANKEAPGWEVTIS